MRQAWKGTNRAFETGNNGIVTVFLLILVATCEKWMKMLMEIHVQVHREEVLKKAEAVADKLSGMEHMKAWNMIIQNKRR